MGSMRPQNEITRGAFDPRPYREDDPVNWARKRRSDWLAVTGKIHYVRERTVASQERELEEAREHQAMVEQEEQASAAVVKPQDEKPVVAKPSSSENDQFWPR